VWWLTWSTAMDFAFLLIAAVFFAASVGLVKLCEGLMP
jgi:hypothetical protein